MSIISGEDHILSIIAGVEDKRMEVTKEKVLVLRNANFIN